MAVYKFDFRKAPPAQGGDRDDYLTPGRHRFKVTTYSDKESAGGKEMHTFTVVVQNGPDKGKRLTDRFAMPKARGDSLFPVQRLHAFFISCGMKNTLGKTVTLDPSKLIGREFSAEVGDERQEAKTVGDRSFAARTVSRIIDYLPPKALEDQDDDEEGEDEDDEDIDDDEEEDEEEEDDDETDDDDDEEEDEDDDEEEEEPAPRRRASSNSRSGRTAVAERPTKTARSAPAKTSKKAAPAKAAKKPSRRAEPADDEDEFPFGDDD